MGYWMSPFWGTIIIVSIVAWVVTVWIRARHGYPLEDMSGRQSRRENAGSNVVDELRETIAAQQAAMEKLEERVRVLERIATDDRGRLRQEIDRLRA